MRFFIADVMLNRVKPRKVGRANNTSRDVAIFRVVTNLIDNGEKLTSSAAVKVAEKYGLETDVVIKVYGKIRKKIADRDNELLVYGKN